MYYYFSEVVGVPLRKISLKVLENEEAGTQTVIYGIILLYLTGYLCDNTYNDAEKAVRVFGDFPVKFFPKEINQGFQFIAGVLVGSVLLQSVEHYRVGSQFDVILLSVHVTTCRC